MRTKRFLFRILIFLQFILSSTFCTICSCSFHLLDVFCLYYLNFFHLFNSFLFSFPSNWFLWSILPIHSSLPSPFSLTLFFPLHDYFYPSHEVFIFLATSIHLCDFYHPFHLEENWYFLSCSFTFFLTVHSLPTITCVVPAFAHGLPLIRCMIHLSLCYIFLLSFPLFTSPNAILFIYPISLSKPFSFSFPSLHMKTK